MLFWDFVFSTYTLFQFAVTDHSEQRLFRDFVFQILRFSFRRVVFFWRNLKHFLLRLLNVFFYIKDKHVNLSLWKRKTHQYTSILCTRTYCPVCNMDSETNISLISLKQSHSFFFNALHVLKKTPFFQLKKAFLQLWLGWSSVTGTETVHLVFVSCICLACFSLVSVLWHSSFTLACDRLRLFQGPVTLTSESNSIDVFHVFL